MEMLLTKNSYSNYIIIGLFQGLTLGQLVDNISKHAIENETDINYSTSTETKRETCYNFKLLLFGKVYKYIYQWYSYGVINNKEGWEFRYWFDGELQGGTPIMEPMNQHLNNTLFNKISKHLQTSEPIT